MSNVPKLRFKEFSGEWEENKLEKYCNKIASGKSKQNENGEYYLYGSTGVIGRTDKYSNDGKFILIARVGANAGLTNVVEGCFGVTDNTLVLDLKDDVDIDFILSLLHKYNLNRLIFGSGQPLITGGQLKSLKLNFPSKQEQEKIALFLTSVDTKIEQLTKKEKLLQQYKKGVMQKIFNQEIRFRADDGSEFCEWEGKKLDDVLKTVSTKLYQIKNSDILSEGLFKVVDQGQKTIAGYSNDTEKVYSSGDIIVYGDHTTIVKYIDFDFIVGADGTKLLNTTKDNNLKYMYYNLVFNNIEAEGYKRHFSILRNITLQIPSLKEQIKIANFLSSVDSKIEQVNKQLHSIKEFKKALLQQMFV